MADAPRPTASAASRPGGVAALGEPLSLWAARAATRSVPSFPALDADLETEVLVIGGGLTGLSVAAHLHAAGARVALVEARTLGGQTGRSTGHLTELIDAGYAAVRKDHGEDAAQAVRAAVRQAIDDAEQLAERYAPEAAFRRVPAYLHDDPESARGPADVADEAEAAAASGVAVETGAAPPVPYPVRAALRAAEQADFDPLAYVHGLARGLAAAGVAIYEHTRLAPPSGGDRPEVRTEDGRFTLRARRIVVATHSPLGVSPLHTTMAPYDSYVVAFALPGGAPPDALVFDTADTYHYLRSAEGPDGERLLVVGGADRKTGHNHEGVRPFDELVAWVQARYPGAEPRYRWSGMWFDPADGLPAIGRLPLSENVLVGTGYAGDGLLWGSVAGRMLAEMALGHDHPCADVLSPSRIKPLAGGPTWLKENADVAVSMVKDRFVSDVSSPDELRPGEGGLVFEGGRHLAVYRDDAGALHARSPVCTHLGCVVRWDGAGGVWACPCHGSRFDPVSGEVVDGPASVGLKAEGAA